MTRARLLRYSASAAVVLALAWLALRPTPVPVDTVLADTGAVVANVRARALSDPELIRALLVEQVTGAVRWRESMSYLAAEGVTEIWEIGAGKALSGMIRRIERAIACQAVGNPEDIAKLQGA